MTLDRQETLDRRQRPNEILSCGVGQHCAGLGVARRMRDRSFGAYRPRVPALTTPPLLGICRLTSGEEIPCIAISLHDWEAVLRELQAACAALGGSIDDCLGR